MITVTISGNEKDKNRLCKLIKKADALIMGMQSLGEGEDRRFYAKIALRDRKYKKIASKLASLGSIDVVS